MERRELKEILKAEDKDLRDELEKYKGLYEKYRQLYVDIKYKYDCLENDYNIEKKKDDDAEFCLKIRNLIPTKVLVSAGCFQLSNRDDIIKFIEGISKEYIEVEKNMRYYKSLWLEYASKSFSFNGSTNDIFSKNKDNWKRLLKDMAMKYHPDHGGDHNMMIFVNEVRKELKGIL